MNPLSLLFVDPPDLADESVCQMLDFLYQLTNAFENHYAPQIRRFYQQNHQSQADLFEHFDDQSPTF